MADQMDTKVMALFEVLRTRRAAVEHDESLLKKKWVTNTSLQLPSRTTPMNIITATEAAVRQAMIELLQMQDYSRQADEALDLPVNDKFGGYFYSEWKDDLRRRMTQLKLKEKKAELADLESRLNLIVSPEQRRAMELAEISKSLGV